MRYGLPYKGNKSAIASKIFNDLPRHLNFYDLFGGGGAMTHYALLTGQYTSVHYNEINPLVADLFKKALSGEYKDETRWISREDFFRMKDTDGFVKIVWSFGNNGQTYLYGKEVEPFKKALHYAIVYGDYSVMKEYNGWDLSPLDRYTTWNERRLFYRCELIKTLPGVYKKGSHYFWNKFQQFDIIQHLQHLERVQNVQKLEFQGEQLIRLEHLERVQNVQKLKFEGEALIALEHLKNTQNIQNLGYNKTSIPSITSTDYQQVSILPNSLLYCDIPYRNTEKYDNDFNYERFYEWASAQKELVVVSEYSMPDNFICIAEYDKRVLFNDTVKNKVAKEKLFIPKHQKELYETLMNEFRLF